MKETGSDIERLIDRAYEALAFEPGAEPDWASFDACFIVEAVLALRVFPGDDDIAVLTLRDYAHSQMRHDLGSEGYSETPGVRTVQVVGDIAVVQQHFTMNFRSGPVPALDVFSLARGPAGWRIVSVVSDIVRPEP